MCEWKRLDRGVPPGDSLWPVEVRREIGGGDAVERVQQLDVTAPEPRPCHTIARGEQRLPVIPVARGDAGARDVGIVVDRDRHEHAQDLEGAGGELAIGRRGVAGRMQRPARDVDRRRAMCDRGRGGRRVPGGVCGGQCADVRGELAGELGLEAIERELRLERTGHARPWESTASGCRAGRARRSRA